MYFFSNLNENSCKIKKYILVLLPVAFETLSFLRKIFDVIKHATIMPMIK